MVIATRYIGRTFAPGDVLPDDLPKEKLEWLIQAGAVIERPGETPVLETKPEAETPLPPDDVLAESASESAGEDLIDEEAEAPEIDVIDGLVTPPAEAEKPKKGGRRKSK